MCRKTGVELDGHGERDKRGQKELEGNTEENKHGAQRNQERQKGHGTEIKEEKRKITELRGRARRPKIKGDFTQTEISPTVTHPDQACLQKSQFGSLERGEGKSQSFRFEH